MNSALRRLICFLGFGLFMAMPVIVQGQWRTINSATSNGSACYTLTPNVNPKVGAIEHAQVQNMDSAFTIQTSMYFGASPSIWGIAFYIKASPVSSLPVNNGFGLAGLDSLIAVEFDIFRDVTNNDPAQNHMAIFKNGVFDHSSSSLLSTQNLYALTDGAYHNATISWTPKYSNLDSSLLRVVFDCDSVLDLYYNIKDSILLGQTDAYIGFSASSTNGASFTDHSICIHHSTLENLRDTALCAGDSLQIEVPYYGTSYSWTPATGISNTSIRQPIFYPSASYHLHFERNGLLRQCCEWIPLRSSETTSSVNFKSDSREPMRPRPHSAAFYGYRRLCRHHGIPLSLERRLEGFPSHRQSV